MANRSRHPLFTYFSGAKLCTKLFAISAHVKKHRRGQKLSDRKKSTYCIFVLCEGFYHQKEQKPEIRKLKKAAKKIAEQKRTFYSHKEIRKGKFKERGKSFFDPIVSSFSMTRCGSRCSMKGRQGIRSSFYWKSFVPLKTLNQYLGTKRSKV